ncbi:MAG: hypothetical protein AAF727_16770 [Pseudomonadota bacterium]
MFDTIKSTVLAVTIIIAGSMADAATFDTTDGILPDGGLSTLQDERATRTAESRATLSGAGFAT